MDLAFDVVIPTTRLNSERLAQLLRVHDSVPRSKVAYFVVVDRPGADLAEISALVRHRPDVSLIQNKTWLGAHGTRNRGIDEGTAEHILFLDDDVVPSPRLLAEYAAAIVAAPECPGFVRVTRFPAASNDFTRGIIASDILAFFDLAERQPQMPWGVTANLCLRRAALGDVRFSNSFPKAGGGEDIDLCLRLASGQPLVSVPAAWVEHPWWVDGRGSYRRFFRWAYGDSRLPALHPQHRYWNGPTLPEALLLLVPLSLFAPTIPLLAALAVVPAFLAIELAVDYGKLWRRGRRPPLRIAVESTVIRVTNDLGRVLGNLARGRVWGLLERFDYFCDRMHVAGEQRIAGAKLVGWLAVVAVIGWFARG